MFVQLCIVQITRSHPSSEEMVLTTKVGVGRLKGGLGESFDHGSWVSRFLSTWVAYDVLTILCCTLCDTRPHIFYRVE